MRRSLSQTRRAVVGCSDAADHWGIERNVDVDLATAGRAIGRAIPGRERVRAIGK